MTANILTDINICTFVYVRCIYTKSTPIRTIIRAFVYTKKLNIFILLFDFLSIQKTETICTNISVF